MGLIVPLVLVEAGIFLVLVATGELAVTAAAAGFAVLAVMSVVLVWPLVSGVESIRSWIVRRSGLPDLEPPSAAPWATRFAVAVRPARREPRSR